MTIRNNIISLKKAKKALEALAIVTDEEDKGKGVFPPEVHKVLETALLEVHNYYEKKDKGYSIYVHFLEEGGRKGDMSINNYIPDEEFLASTVWYAQCLTEALEDLHSDIAAEIKLEKYIRYTEEKEK